MNVVDSSGWLEYLADGPNAQFFSSPIQDVANLIVPTVSMLEVFKRVSEQRGDDLALQAVALMQQGHVIDLTAPLALQAAKFSRQFKLPLADSVIYASSQFHKATLWTQDADFKNLPDVKFITKKK